VVGVIDYPSSVSRIYLGLRSDRVNLSGTDFAFA
jgi:hypothetical protein